LIAVLFDVLLTILISVPILLILMWIILRIYKLIKKSDISFSQLFDSNTKSGLRLFWVVLIIFWILLIGGTYLLSL
jgi:hypothetical protein